MNHEENIKISFSGNEYLEGVISYPEEMADKRAVLLCSPHPHFAGNMDNNIIKALYSFLSSKGVIVMRYNYRGVGNSTINLPEDRSIFDYWNDVEEKKEYAKTLEDTEACLNFLSGFHAGLRLYMIGYSFGAIMAMIAGLRNPSVKLITGIAPPLSEYDFSPMSSPDKRTYLIGSSGDFVYSRDEFMALCGGMSALNGHDFFNDSDHFFRGREGVLSETIWRYIEADNK